VDGKVERDEECFVWSDIYILHFNISVLSPGEGINQSVLLSTIAFFELSLFEMPCRAISKGALIEERQL
jgi:hypothetical protein